MLSHGKWRVGHPAVRRAATAAVAAGLAAACAMLSAAPALADQVRQEEWWLGALHVTQAWESSKGAGITVAVLDTGVNPSQPDLVGSVTTGPDYTHSGRLSGGPYWGIDGTAMASVIAGHGHGPGHSEGIIGIAPKARILSVRVTLDPGDPLLQDPAATSVLPGSIAAGIRYAVSHGAQVIDLPLDPVITPGAAGAGGSKAEQAAVRYALLKNVVLVAPAGDAGAGADPVEYPAAYPGVISVGAFDASFTKAPFSSRQSYVTVTAAGSNMTVAGPPVTSAGYTTVSTTGAASAVVAGIAALIKSQFPALTPAQVTSALTVSTIYRPAGGKADGSGFGTVDARAALLAAASIDETVQPAVSATPSARQPAAPARSSAGPQAGKSLGSVIVTYAGIAVAVFVLLIGLILLVSWLRRRRARAARLAPVREALRPTASKAAVPLTVPPGPGQRAGLYGNAGMNALAGALSGPGHAAGAGAGNGTDGGWSAQAGGAASEVTDTMPALRQDSGLPNGVAPANGAGAGVGVGLARRTGSPASRSAAGPPWEPAQPPQSELPWTATAAPQPAVSELVARRLRSATAAARQISGTGPAAPPPPANTGQGSLGHGSLGHGTARQGTTEQGGLGQGGSAPAGGKAAGSQARQEPAWASGAGAARGSAQPMTPPWDKKPAGPPWETSPAPAPEPQQPGPPWEDLSDPGAPGGGGRQRTDASGRPIYVWNPGATTDSIPAIRTSDTRRP